MKKAQYWQTRSSRDPPYPRGQSCPRTVTRFPDDSIQGTGARVGPSWNPEDLKDLKSHGFWNPCCLGPWNQSDRSLCLHGPWGPHTGSWLLAKAAGRRDDWLPCARLGRCSLSVEMRLITANGGKPVNPLTNPRFLKAHIYIDIFPGASKQQQNQGSSYTDIPSPTILALSPPAQCQGPTTQGLAGLDGTAAREPGCKGVMMGAVQKNGGLLWGIHRHSPAYDFKVLGFPSSAVQGPREGGGRECRTARERHAVWIPVCRRGAVSK